MLHVLAAPDGTPRAAILASADQEERDVALRLFEIGLHGGELVSATRATPAATSNRPPASASARRSYGRRPRPSRGEDRPCPGSGNFWTRRDRLGPERHRARTLHGLRARIATKLLALAAGVWLNHDLDQPTRSFAALAA
ncbi:MAG: hypothetical protein ACXVII_43415 [Solirubrobacteraceae bacterium]